MECKAANLEELAAAGALDRDIMGLLLEDGHQVPLGGRLDAVRLEVALLVDHAQHARHRHEVTFLQVRELLACTQ